MKHNVLVVVLCLMVVILSACGTEGGGEAVSLEPHSIAGGETSDGGTQPGSAGNSAPTAASGHAQDCGSPESGQIPESGQAALGGGNADVQQDAPASAIDAGARAAAESLSDTDCGIYLQTVNENEGDAITYSLIFLDADDIPELVIYDYYYEDYSIYTIREEQIFCLADSLATVELTYYEKTGIIAAFDRWNGGGDTGGYGRHFYQTAGDRTITRDDQMDKDRAILSYSYNATYNEKGEYMGTGVLEYFHMGQEIDEASYYEELASLGITEGENRICMENSCKKEEIYALLSR